MTISTTSPWVATTAAVILAVASLLLIAKDAINWRQGITDEFGQDSLGLKFGVVFGPVHIVGLLLASACVLSGL